MHSAPVAGTIGIGGRSSIPRAFPRRPGCSFTRSGSTRGAEFLLLPHTAPGVRRAVGVTNAGGFHLCGENCGAVSPITGNCPLRNVSRELLCRRERNSGSWAGAAAHPDAAEPSARSEEAKRAFGMTSPPIKTISTAWIIIDQLLVNGVLGAVRLFESSPPCRPPGGIDVRRLPHQDDANLFAGGDMASEFGGNGDLACLGHRRFELYSLHWQPLPSSWHMPHQTPDRDVIYSVSP